VANGLRLNLTRGSIGAKRGFYCTICAQPFKTLHIPLYYGWASCTIKLKENSLVDDILAENSKIDRK
jgi:hypothetical protein